MASTTGSGTPGSPKPQRRWQAPCPGCGAPVEFQSAASPVAVCSYCRSTVVRDGESLRKIGQSAELFDDHSPLQLGAGGKYRDRSFTLVGRLQIGYGANLTAQTPSSPIDGNWNEWYVLFADGGGAWLSEDNDQYVFTFDVDHPPSVPKPGEIALQQRLLIAGTEWQVASLVQAKLLAAQGELPAPPAMGTVFLIVDLRNAQGRVATIDYSNAEQAKVSVGQAVKLDELSFSGLNDTPDADSKKLAGRNFTCPNCGGSIVPTLADTKSITCGSCKSVVDISQGIGSELRAYQQRSTILSRIPIGRSGSLSITGSMLKDWQVVGFSKKEANSDNPDPEERFSWGEYLLYNRQEGFAFLIDSEDGWVGYRTMTGTPEGGTNASVVKWNGGSYRRTDVYPARVAYVEGEFYWKVDKGQTVKVSDFEGQGAKNRERLSFEESGSEVIWSQGKVISATVVGQAFGLTIEERFAFRSDIRPVSGGVPSLWSIAIVIIFIILFALSECSNNCNDDGTGNCYGSGTSGGAYGGYSSGGGHK